MATPVDTKGQTRTLRARYLVGCDGGGSRVHAAQTSRWLVVKCEDSLSNNTHPHFPFCSKKDRPECHSNLCLISWINSSLQISRARRKFSFRTVLARFPGWNGICYRSGWKGYFHSPLFPTGIQQQPWSSWGSIQDDQRLFGKLGDQYWRDPCS